MQINCNWFGDRLETDPVSKQAFSQARQKLSPECFQELFNEALRENYSLTAKNGLWKGYRLIACDGSTVRLPESEELAHEQLPEVVEKMRDFGQDHLLFVYDRGCPSEAFINQHLESEVDFIFRLPKNFNKTADKIHKQGDSERLLLSENWPLLRVVQFDLSSGKIELLLTTLTDELLYPVECLSSVYQGHWTTMEEGYKKQKILMQLENFSSKIGLAIEQEYWATLLVISKMGCIELEGYCLLGFIQSSVSCSTDYRTSKFCGFWRELIRERRSLDAYLTLF